MLGLATVISLITMAAAAAAAAAKGSVDPCANGVYHPNQFHDVKIHCNTTLSEYSHDKAYFRPYHTTYKTFNKCVDACFGIHNGQNCCAARYNKETMACTTIFAHASVCTRQGRRFVGASNETFNIAAINEF